MKTLKQEQIEISEHKNIKIKNCFDVFKFLSFKTSDDRRGMAALIVVVIIGSALLLMAYSAVFLGLGDLEMGYHSQRGDEALSVADGCLEEALHRLRKNNSYAGASLTLDNGTCVIAVSGSGATRTIEVSAVSDAYTKRIQAGVSISGNIISVTSWQELTN